MVCRDGKCEAECPPRTIYVNGECRFDQWGEACVCSPDTCVEADTECQDGYCECKDPGLEYSHYLNMCVGQNYGDPCSTYQDTCDKHIRLQCINGECTCPHGTRPVGDPAICCDDCSHGQECCLDGVGCRIGKCHCKHGAVVFDSTKVCCDDCSKVPHSHCCTQLEEENGKCHAGECMCDFEEASRYPHVCCPDCTSTLAKCCVSGDIACVGHEGECVCIFESTMTNPEHCCPDCPRGFYCTESGTCEKRSPYSAQCGGPGAQYPENSCSNEVGMACLSFIECGVQGLTPCDMKFCICDWSKGWRFNGEGCCNDKYKEHACSNDDTLVDDGSGDDEII
ncbi:tenascin-like [Mya arenaria]|uniref:tenascin-like n=1 Tax=Mya arenaria TaxID=6604 RepID=UPI0022E81FF3|nr:tenascin-like [Mya arenaria]